MDVSEDVVETHGLTKLVHHVLSDSYVPDDYLKGIPYYDALRKYVALALCCHSKNRPCCSVCGVVGSTYTIERNRIWLLQRKSICGE